MPTHMPPCHQKVVSQQPGTYRKNRQILPHLLLLPSAMSTSHPPIPSQPDSSMQQLSSNGDIEMLHRSSCRTRLPLTDNLDQDVLDLSRTDLTSGQFTESEIASNIIDLCDDLPDPFGQSSAPDSDFNFLDDPVQYGELSPYANEAGISMDELAAGLEDRAFMSLNILPASDEWPNFAIYDEQRNRKPEMPNFSGAIINEVVLPLLKDSNLRSVPNAEDFAQLFGEYDWLCRLSNESSVFRRAVEYSYEWSVVREIEEFIENHEDMTLEDTQVFALPHNPGYVYMVVNGEEELQHLDTFILQLPLVSPTSLLIPVEERASELAFPSAPDAYDLHPHDGDWVKVVRGLYANDFGYVQRFLPNNRTTRPYPIVEVIVIPRVCLAFCKLQKTSDGSGCACSIRRPDPIVFSGNAGAVATCEELFAHPGYPWGIEPRSGLHRILLPANHVIHSPYILPSVWEQFYPQLLAFPGLTRFNHPLTADQLFPPFHTVVVKQNGYTSSPHLIVSPPFLANIASPHDLAFSLLAWDRIPEYPVPSHLVNDDDIYTSRLAMLSSVLNVGSTVKLRCNIDDQRTFLVLKVEDSDRIILRLTGEDELNTLFCVRNVEALLLVGGPAYIKQCRVAAHVPLLFTPLQMDKSVNMNSSFHPSKSWLGLRVYLLPIVQPLNDPRLFFKARQGHIADVRTTREWRPSFPSGLIVSMSIDGSSQVIDCDLFDLAWEDSKSQWSWLSDSRQLELSNTRGLFWHLLGYRPPPKVGMVQEDVLPTPKTPPFHGTTLPESNLPEVFRTEASFPDPPSPVGAEDTTPQHLDVLWHPRLEGCSIVFSLISPPSSATRKEKEGSLAGVIVNVAGIHYVRYQPGRVEGVTKDAPLRSIACLTSVGSPSQKATTGKRQVRLLDWRSKYFGEAFVIVGADDTSVPFLERFVYVVRVEGLKDMEIMLESHLFRVLARKLVPCGDGRDRDGGNPELCQEYRKHISNLQKRSAHLLHVLKTL
ncbi:hypothetical protein DL96DRAFT_1565280 [Flagelloscypha sp. PMI_526]|nr:hypothetical protein DL96DRAFT_1565280 [Flagelloscypha sp. PMI_526]